MYAYLIRRCATGLLVVFGVLTLVFFSLYLTPGDPIDALIPPGRSGAAAAQLAAQLKARYGLDKPVYEQYLIYLNHLVRLDLGRSIRTDRPVAADLADHFPATLELASFSLMITLVVGVITGVVSAVRRNGLLDGVVTVLALGGVSLPGFLLGLLLILLFSLKFPLLPPAGRGATFFSWDGLSHIILPSITLALQSTGLLTRLVRSAVLDVLQEDYIRTARAKGLAERTVIFRHALRNAMIPVVTVFGLQFAGLLGGAVVTETVFAWPGVGRYLLLALVGKDFAAVQAGVILVSLSFVTVNILVDLCYAVLDPRVSYQ
ncbi:MAG TPA: ABC transporter permease [Symbiobacteriaceae bacterium]|nr:ABC transporter permease [Symbiobacteriaceae bacterium]